MSMEGDGQNGQPAEGVATISDLSAMLDDGDESELDAQDESEGDETEETEGEEVEAGAEDEEREEEPTVTLKHDGKEFTLKQSEVVELAQKGYDYSQKTMAVAEERRAVEEIKARASELRQQNEQVLNDHLGRLQALEQFLEGQVGHAPTADLIQSHGIEYYVAQKEQHEHRKGQLEQARKAIDQAQQEQSRQRQDWATKKADETEKALRDTLPGWNENTLNELIGYAGKYGIGNSVFGEVLLQKGFWELAHKAKAYDALLEKKAQMKPVSKLAKVAPPGTRTQPPQLAKHQAAHKQYREKPSMDNLAAMLD
ncbi:hypothetical protein ACYX7E_09945 [Luteimonas sp. RIT-PG2_3]